MATQTKTSIPGPSFNPSDRSGAYKRFYEDLLSRSDQIDHTNPEADLKGAVLTFPIADGRAIYVVVKNKPLTLSHVAYGDEWQVPDALIRGIRRADVFQQLGRAAWWKSLETV